MHQVSCPRGQAHTHSSRGMRRRVNDTPGKTNAVNGLFKIIAFSSNPDSPLVLETLLTESERLADTYN